MCADRWRQPMANPDQDCSTAGNSRPDLGLHGHGNKQIGRVPHDHAVKTGGSDSEDGERTSVDQKTTGMVRARLNQNLSRNMATECPAWRSQMRTICSGFNRTDRWRLSIRTKSFPAPFIFVNSITIVQNASSPLRRTPTQTSKRCIAQFSRMRPHAKNFHRRRTHAARRSLFVSAAQRLRSKNNFGIDGRELKRVLFFPR